MAVAPAAYEPSEAAISTTNPTSAIAGTAVQTDIEAAVASVIETAPMPATSPYVEQPGPGRTGRVQEQQQRERAERGERRHLRVVGESRRPRRRRSG